MRYLVDLTKNQKQKISRFINEKKYDNIQEFIITAIDNQIYMEETDIGQQSVHQQSVPISTNQTDKIVTLVEKEYDLNGSLSKDFDVISHPVKLKNNPTTLESPKFEELSSFVLKQGNILDEQNAWLWGQVNRIFPIKLGLRVLLYLLENKQVTELESFLNKAAKVASSYGKMLREREQISGKLRDEKISTGLPMSDQYEGTEFRSMNRYKSHFLLTMRKDGKLDGAMPCLRFVNIKKNSGDKKYIGLTDAGLAFAKLDNPVIDYREYEKSLGTEEIDFYLNHVSQNVKGEHKAILWLLGKLEGGIREREKINQELKNDFKEGWEYSDKVINTQRSGLMARLFELGLIDKEKSGVSVQYKTTERGRKYLFKERG